MCSSDRLKVSLDGHGGWRQDRLLLFPVGQYRSVHAAQSGHAALYTGVVSHESCTCGSETYHREHGMFRSHWSVSTGRAKPLSRTYVFYSDRKEDRVSYLVQAGLDHMEDLSRTFLESQQCYTQMLEYQSDSLYDDTRYSSYQFISLLPVPPGEIYAQDSPITFTFPSPALWLLIFFSTILALSILIHLL